MPIPVEGAFDRLSVDCLGPFPPTDRGQRYLVVFCDALTRWTEAFPVPSIDAPTPRGVLRYISDGDVRMRRNCQTQKKSFRLDLGPKKVQRPRT